MLWVDMSAPVGKEIVKCSRCIVRQHWDTVSVRPHLDSNQHNANVQRLVQLQTDRYTSSADIMVGRPLLATRRRTVQY